MLAPYLLNIFLGVRRQATPSKPSAALQLRLPPGDITPQPVATRATTYAPIAAPARSSTAIEGPASRAMPDTTPTVPAVRPPPPTRRETVITARDERELRETIATVRHLGIDGGITVLQTEHGDLLTPVDFPDRYKRHDSRWTIRFVDGVPFPGNNRVIGRPVRVVQIEHAA